MVITMTVLLALALIAVVWGFVRQGRLLASKSQPASLTVLESPPAAAGSLATLTLAPGVRIVSAQAQGGRLVLHLIGPTGDEVQIIDMGTGALVRQVKTQPR